MKRRVRKRDRHLATAHGVDHFERAKTLEELEGHRWGPPTYHSRLVQTCHQLRKKPLNEFTVEDLRIMIGQNIGLKALVPIAMKVLESDPLAAGDFYPGDLFGAVLRAEHAFWVENPKLHTRVAELLRVSGPLPEELRDAVANFESFMRWRSRSR